MSEQSLTDAVRQARDPREAMILLAQHLEYQGGLLERLLVEKGQRDTAAPSWGTWKASDWAAPADEITGLREIVKNANVLHHEPWEAKPADHDEARIAGLEKALAEAHDPDDRRALEAQLRLAKDNGAVVERSGFVDAPSSFTATYGPNNIEVSLPIVSEQRQASRRKLAEAARLPEYLTHLDPEDALTGFAKGGPLWLYLDNRDVVMQLPVAVRQAFVMDVMTDSPKDAQEMARDILKSESPGDPELAIDTLSRYSENGL